MLWYIHYLDQRHINCTVCYSHLSYSFRISWKHCILRLTGHRRCILTLGQLLCRWRFASCRRARGLGTFHRCCILTGPPRRQSPIRSRSPERCRRTGRQRHGAIETGMNVQDFKQTGKWICNLTYVVSVCRGGMVGRGGQSPKHQNETSKSNLKK